jgi:hypothetical protein
MRTVGADALRTKGVANEALIAACHRVVGR